MVRSSAASNARWTGFSQAAKIFVQLGSLVILARLLPPNDYGLMAMASVVVNFAMLLRDMGTSAAIIQRNELKDETICTVFWLNLTLGVGIALAVSASATTIAEYFGAPRLSYVLYGIALTFPLMGGSAVHQALLERRSQFRSVSLIEVSASTLSLLGAICGAVAGLGVFSLVIQSLVNAIVSSIGLWVASAWRPKLLLNMKELRGLIGFSGNLTAFNIVNYFSRNADGMIIGRALGATVLGAYSMAYKLMLFPLQSLTFVASRALYPVMSRQQARLADMATLYLRAVRVIAMVTAPLMAGLFVLRGPFVDFAFGEQWRSVVPILAWLAPVGFIQSIVSTTGTVFMARGKTHILLRLGVMSAFLQVGAFVAGVRWGVTGVAACYCLANIVNAFPCLIVTMRQLEASPLRLVSAVSPAICSALVMAALLWGLQGTTIFTLATYHAGLILSVGAGIVTYGVLYFIVLRQGMSDIRALAGI